MCAKPSLTLQIDVPSLRRQALRQAPPKKEVIYPFDLRNLHHANLRIGVPRCRDSQRRARLIICVLFWAVMSSLIAVSLYLFLLLTLTLYLITAPTSAST